MALYWERATTPSPDEERASMSEQGERCKICEQVIKPGERIKMGVLGGLVHVTTWDCVMYMKAHIPELEASVVDMRDKLLLERERREEMEAEHGDS
jgi:hypothetical protein